MNYRKSKKYAYSRNLGSWELKYKGTSIGMPSRDANSRIYKESQETMGKPAMRR